MALNLLKWEMKMFNHFFHFRIHALKAASLWLPLATAFLALAPASARAGVQPGETAIPFRGKEVYVQGNPMRVSVGDPEVDGDLILIFTNSAVANSFRTELPIEARVLMVGGGGAGGYGATSGTLYPGGGGGGGDVKEFESQRYEAATFTIEPGAGGAMKTAAGSGDDGSPTSLTFPLGSFTVLGGGGGGAKSDGKGGEKVATGGGGAGNAKYLGGVGTLGENGKGGNAGGTNRGGGGGGATGPGDPGVSGKKAGDGGTGIQSDIWPDDEGKPRGFGGGGGGGQTSNNSDDNVGAGKDGGGRGGRQSRRGDDGAFATGGGGGGGGRGTGQYAYGGAGGCGAVIIRLTYIEVPINWQDITVTVGTNTSVVSIDEHAYYERDGEDLVLYFTNVSYRGALKIGTPEMPIWAQARILAIGGGGGGGFVDKRTVGGVPAGGGGGGGAGGFVDKSGFLVDTNFQFSIVIGRGGAGGAVDGESGQSGEDSTVTTNGQTETSLIAYGGGGGGARYVGLSGASGGGGSGGLDNRGYPEAYEGGAAVNLQGNVGGLGQTDYRGAGGGGATEAGAPSTANAPGAGGAGRSSDITGTEIVYAGGGGGGYLNAANYNNYGPGGAGGAGGGGAGAGAGLIDGVVTNIAAEAGKDGFGGGGGGTAQADAISPAGRGGNGIVIIRLSGLVVGSIPVPEQGRTFTYDGREYVGVDPFFAYSFVTNAADYRTWPVGVNADNYTVTIRIAADAPYEWGDATGGKGDRVVKWKIVPHEVKVPETYYTDYVFKTQGTSGTAAAKTYVWDAYPQDKGKDADAQGRCWTTLEPGSTNVHYCTISGNKGGDAGDYWMKCALNNDYVSTINVTNFVWESAASGPLVDQKVYWQIKQAENEITKLTIENWQEGTTNKTPVVNWKWEAAAKDYATTGNVDKVQYQWRPEKDGTLWSDLKALDEGFVFPTEAGRYLLRAYIRKDSNHNPGNWVEAEREIPFVIWRHPAKMLADWIDMTASYSSSKYIELSLRDPVRDPSTGAITGGYPGFRYFDVVGDGDLAELRFVAISNRTSVAECDKANPYARDELLAFKAASWNRDGVSVIRVKMPPTSKSPNRVRMYWRRRPGQGKLPADLLASDVTATSGNSATLQVVNQLQSVENGQDVRAWVNYWTKEPVVTRYVEVDKLLPKDIAAGTLKVGTVVTTYRAMPSGEIVDFNDVKTNVGPYTVNFTMKDIELGTSTYPGLHKYYDGDRTLDLEIYKDRPAPIDPTGGGSGVTNLRVLLANDDIRTGEDAANSVSNQEYAVWKHDNLDDPPETFTNLLPGAAHTLTNSLGVALWKVEDVYLGNMLSTNANYRSLPSSATASANCQLVLRNLGDLGGVRDAYDDALGAEIRSPWYTNGVGTIYFDALNAYVTNKPAAFRLVVEVSTNAFDNMTQTQKSNAVWQVVNNVKVLKFTGAAFSSWKGSVSEIELDCNDKIVSGNVSNRFFRIIAPVPDELKRQPLRFRIHRVTQLEADEGISMDDPRGFILIDNVIASWPTDVADCGSPGGYDPSRTGKDVLGWETAFSVNYPSATESNLYASARYSGDPSLVTSARLHYRWRYLDAQFSPERVRVNDHDNFATLYLDPANGFKSLTPLPLTDLAGVAGDLEYWYDFTVVTPFYQYCDYSGCGAKDPIPGYTENPEKGLERRRTESSKLPSHGTDWFVRLRDGDSDYATLNLKVQLVEGLSTNASETISCTLCGNHLWRGFLRTSTAYAGKTLQYRFEGLKTTNPGAAKQVMKTDCWKSARNLERAEDIPNSPSLQTATSNDWATVFCDATTGYLLFQIDDHTLPPALTVTRADYCDFNGWSDAASDEDPPVFTGSAIENEKKSGTSSQTRRMTEDFNWPGVEPTPFEKESWHAAFEGTIDDGTHTGFTPFSSMRADGNWMAYDGQWAARFYHPTDADSRNRSGLALQLFGALGGRLEMTSFGTTIPRGLGSVSFSARVAQSIDFYDFQYTLAEKPSKLTDYTFITRAAFDQNANKDFAGNASLSLVAFYRPKEGCYEARWEQLKGAWDNNTSTFKDGIARDSARLCLYRWAKDAKGNIEPVLLGAVTNNVNVNYSWTNDAKGNKTNKGVNTTGNNRVKQPEATYSNADGGFGGDDYYLPIFIAAKKVSESVTEVSLGVYSCGGNNYNNEKGGLLSTDSETDYNKRNWVVMFYRDASDRHLKDGAYGVLSANCEAVFLRPAKRSAMALPNASNYAYATNQICAWANTAVNFAGTYEEVKEDLADDWEFDNGRMLPFDDTVRYGNANAWGIYADKPEAKVNLWLGDASGANWKCVGSRTVSGFGTNLEPGKEQSFDIRSIENCTVRLEADSVFTDVVITDARFTQWRGDDLGDPEGDTTSYSGITADDYRWGCRDKIVFTTGLVVKEAVKESHAVRLSAKHASPDKASSVRSPLFDGLSGRGVGLGMLGFTYERAQKNTRLLVQIATNQNEVATGNSIKDLTQSVREDTGAGGWTTVTNIDFSACTDEERARGARSVYFGLHGMKGLMRIVLDPELVANVQTNGNTDVNLFGEIDITKFVVRDEPELTAADWWGWNIRAVSSHEPDNSVGDNLRAYLPDGDYEADARGMPLALNNVPDVDVLEEDREVMSEHVPFVQTPTFTNNVVGEVYFKARRYDNGDGSQAAELTLYGASSGTDTGDLNWRELQTIYVTNLIWETYTVRAPGAYSAFRFAVKGGDQSDNDTPRVLLDEVMVFEAVNPTMGFRYVYPFRDGLEETTACTNVVRFLDGGVVEPLEDAQPLAGESWTVQAEIEKRQLPDEIDMTEHPPRVIFHWYEGSARNKWGYAKWRDDPKAKSAELVPADGEKLIFRGSIPLARQAVVEPSTELKAPYVVQYSADVIYYTTAGTELTNSLVLNASTTWTRPPWYAPLDYNAGKPAVAGYTIIDSIAPHRVWINEADIFEKREASGDYVETNQYVEVAVPELQSIDGWHLEYVDNAFATDLRTEPYRLVDFSDTETGIGYAPGKKDFSKIPAGQRDLFRTNGYSFITVQSPGSQQSWTKVPGAVDGVWKKFDGSTQASITMGLPVALRLVRASGIVEQEIVLAGTNTWRGQRLEMSKKPEAWIQKLLDKIGGEHNFYYVGDETPNRPDQSQGVIRGTGATSNDWKNLMVQTPGRPNEGQIVPEGYVLLPNGSLMVVRAKIGPDGHVWQSVAGAVDAVDEQTFFLRKGSEGTNITYRLANWWEIGSLTTNGVAIASATGATGVWSLSNLGAGVSNDLEVVVNARPLEKLRTEYGLDEQNPYTPAVMDWLQTGKNYWGEDFAHPGDIHLAEFRTPFTYTYITNLDLTTMYWLDMDPTTNWVLKAGVVASRHGGPHPIILGDADNPPVITNFRMSVHMEITNEMTGVAYAPYVLRGLEPGSTSADYSGNWTSATFKVTADIQNGNPLRARWVPLRWFVFKPDGSKPNRSASFGDDFRSTVDVSDPRSKSLSFWTDGWDAYPNALIFYRWAIDTRSAPVQIDPLTPTSVFSPLD